MRNVDNDFKIDLRTYGRQLDPKIKVNDEDFDTDNFNYMKPAFYTSLFKTIMHQVEIDSKVYMPNNTKLNIKLGVKLNEKSYKYVELGTYYVKTCERQEDTNSYRIMAYTKMKEAMIDYDLKITEKIPLRDYLIRICQRLGWNTENIPAVFINSTKLVDPILHTGIDYTFRDVLDEIATLSCSFLLFKDDDFYLRYLTPVDANIDESYLDEDNITIGEKYFINSLVFSRAEESDNIYRKDDSNITLNGLHEYRISDCQLLSTNDRADYIDEMFEYLKTLEFYTFDIQSKGILFLEACDMFNLTLNGVTYLIALLNDEINIEDGLTETLYMDEPGETETEYKYADSTDKKINQTYIIVDKQNQKIESVISNVTEQNQKIARVTQTVDELNSKISDIADITDSKESLNGTVSFEKVNQSEPIYVKIYPTGENISYLYPNVNLFPSENLFLKVRTLRFINTTTNEYVDYELPTDLLYYDAENYDEFILDYDAQTCIVNKRVGYKADGTTYLLETATTIEYDFPKIQLTDGDYTVTLLGYDNAYMLVKLMLQNIYTTQFATKVEVKSEISQTASGINSSVEKKLTKYTETEKLGTFIEQNWEYIKIAWNQISQYLKLEGIAGKATLNIYDQNNNMLMSLSQDGQKFYDTNGNEIGTIGVVREDSRDTLAFAMNVDWDSVNESKSMAWGYFDKKGKFLPVFHLVGTYGAETSEYGGKLAIEGGLSTESLEVIGNTIESGDTSFNIVDANGNTIFSADTSTPFFNIVNLILSYISDSGKQCIDFSDCVLTNMKNVPQTDENLNYISGSANSHIFASFKDGGSVIIFENSSDMNLKKNIKKSSHVALDKIKKIKHKEFDWKSNNKHQDIGYIAQEMKEIDESFVHYSKYKDQNGEEKENWQINTLSVLATVTKAIQEQNKEIEELKKKDKQKDEQINQLQNEINELKKERE